MDGREILFGHNHNACGDGIGSMEPAIEIARSHLDLSAFTGHSSWHDLEPTEDGRELISGASETEFGAAGLNGPQFIAEDYLADPARGIGGERRSRRVQGSASSATRSAWRDASLTRRRPVPRADANKGAARAAGVERALGPCDLPECLLLSSEAGWNQTAADWQLILTIGRGLGIVDGLRLVATAAVVPLGARLGWICMVLVTRDARRQGLATRLMQWAVDALAAEGRVAGLDATPAGRKVYRRLEFAGEGTITRLLAEHVDACDLNSAAVRALTRDDMQAVAAFDARTFGAERGAILADLYRRRPDLAALAEARGQVSGYLVAREGRFATHLGPVVAKDAVTARRLLSHALARVEGPVLIDLADRHETLRDWIGTRGFVAQRGFTRMLNGRADGGDPTRVFAIAGPELG